MSAVNENNPVPPPTAPTTLSELVAAADFNLRWFDVGRRVQPISRKAAEAFEQGTSPWPHPYLRQAWCGLLLWPAGEPGSASLPVVWFLRFPLDEQGKLLLPIRDRFLKQLQQGLYAGEGQGANGHRDPGKHLQRTLEQSELIFNPPADKRAVFHAKAGQILRRPYSDHYPAAKAYAKDPACFPWEQLAVQGLADLAVRWEEEKESLCHSLPRFATPALIALCQCLESETIDHQLVQPLISRGEQSLASGEPDTALLTALVRGISHSPASGMRQQFLLTLLQSLAGTNGEVLAAIGSRCTDDLFVPEIAQLWLEKLSESQPQETFNLLLTDLLFLPQLRNVLLAVLRNPERTEGLALAFGAFLNPAGK
ncbi:DUF3549 family protein [Microbulbifer bruguierae]|uniref:DUF3549 family protein n=1 Tax=Microbulbifer bruguierae TaxID=3029061 RepID=A0ABY8NIX2_9GAMM|nr:DUF3549 family protein [Microbulbifer bruguierae]WGL17538.1 DUF3549 family protein [Microbulbifer bruguierae]